MLGMMADSAAVYHDTQQVLHHHVLHGMSVLHAIHGTG